MVSRALQLLASRAGSADLLDVAAAHAEEALELATEAADDWAIALASFAHAMASSTMVELRERAEQAATRLAQVGNAYHLADLLSSAAYGAICMDSDRDAKAFVDRARPVTRELDNRYLWMMLDGNSGLAALFTGDVRTARDAFREELALSRELVVQPFAHEGLNGLAAVAIVDGDDDRAARLAGAAEAHRYGEPGDAVQDRLNATFFEPARTRHGADAWDAAAAEGGSLSFADAVAYGLEERRA